MTAILAVSACCFLGCASQPAYVGAGFPPAQDSCTVGVGFTYHSDRTWDLDTKAECTKYRRIRNGSVPAGVYGVAQ